MGNWISVKDKLPENSKEVLVNLRDSGVFMANFLDGRDWHCSKTSESLCPIGFSCAVSSIKK
jgi:hypothetical protein